MKKDEKKIWFKNKYTGLGWVPATREGWAVTITAVLLTMAAVLWSDKNPENPKWTMAAIITIGVVLVFICIKKGEKLELRWKGKPWLKKK